MLVRSQPVIWGKLIHRLWGFFLCGSLLNVNLFWFLNSLDTSNTALWHIKLIRFFWLFAWALTTLYCLSDVCSLWMSYRKKALSPSSYCLQRVEEPTVYACFWLIHNLFNLWVFFKKFDLELSLFFVGLAQLKKYSLITRTRIIYKCFQKIKGSS